jgi:hypothetical protein
MPRRPPDRALRRQVAQLAALPPEDVEDILVALDQDHRLRIEALLAEYLGLDVTRQDSRATGKPAPTARAGLSPWIVERLGPQASPDNPIRMTPVALDALRGLATVEVTTGVVVDLAAPRPAFPRSWLRHWGRAISGRTSAYGPSR